MAFAQGARGVMDLYGAMLDHGIDLRACRRLEALGIEGRFVAELSSRLAIGAGRVALSRDGRFWEPEGPDARLLLAVVEGGEIADIAAVSTSHPDQVALAAGLGGLLGEEAIERAERAALAQRPVRLRLFRDAMAWLRARGEGVVVLDWAHALPRLRALGERVTIECADATLALELRGKLARGGLPLVSEPMSDDAALSLAERIGRGFLQEAV